MKYIDIKNWTRKKHFDFFMKQDYPVFNLCSNVDITECYHFAKKHKISIFKIILYFVVKAANDIKEFRMRIRGRSVVEHKIVHPSFTVMGDDDVFSFCTVDYTKDFQKFCRHAEKGILQVKKKICLSDKSDRDDLLFITTIPWISFTSFVHPINMHPVDSVPRIAWGKFFEENGKIKLPLSVQVHHAVVDGAHVGKYFSKTQHYFDNISDKRLLTKTIKRI